MTKIPLSVLDLEAEGHHIIIEVEIFETTFNMVLDTGASKTVLDKNILLESHIQDKQLKNTNIMSTGLGTNSMESHVIDLPYLKIGPWQKKNFQVAVLDLSTINYAYEQLNFPKVVGVLGGDILLNYGAVINYKALTLTLNKHKIKQGKTSE